MNLINFLMFLFFIFLFFLLFLLIIVKEFDPKTCTWSDLKAYGKAPVRFSFFFTLVINLQFLYWIF